MEKNYLQKTGMLDYDAPRIQALIRQRGWMELDVFHQIGAAYNFVQNEIVLGYNASDLLTAEQVLKDGYGQCNTKATLLMTLLRGMGIPCRLHGTQVSKHFQKELMLPFMAALAPETIVHTWAEVFYQGKWTALEGVIADQKYLAAVKRRNPDVRGKFFGYAIAVADLQNLDTGWKGTDSFVQREAVVKDFGTFDSPDTFFAEHPQTWGKLKNFAYIHVGRKIMTKKAAKIREEN